MQNPTLPPRGTIGVRDEGQEIDSLLCSLHRAATALHEDVEATRRSARASHVVDFSQFEARANRIASLRHIHTELQKLTAIVAQHGQAADALHQEEIASMQEYIDSTTRVVSAETRVVSADTRRTRAAKATEPRRPPPDPANLGIPWKDKALTARILGRADRGGRPAPPARAPTNPGRSVWDTPPRTPPNIGGAVNVSTPPPADPRAVELSRRKIVLDDHVSLDAVIIPGSLKDPREILAAVSTPELYYIPAWDHFAVRCGAVVFHGNVGKIYPTDTGRAQRAPERVKECRHRGQCPSLKGGEGASCAYYHDPEECPGSRDVRNYIADSWVYAPATTRYSARYGSRRIGSRDSLRGGLQEISASDARRHVAQTTHDILCSIILAKYVLGA